MRGVSTHICAGNVSLGQDTEYIVSTHICAGNVFLWTWGYDWFGRLGFQLIYMRGMFPSPGAATTAHILFQLIYMRGMFLLVCLRWSQVGLVSTHICAGNVSGATVRAGCRGVSTHICAGNVSNWSTLKSELPHSLFQLIYAWGLFQHLCVVLPF